MVSFKLFRRPNFNLGEWEWEKCQRFLSLRYRRAIRSRASATKSPATSHDVAGQLYSHTLYDKMKLKPCLLKHPLDVLPKRAFLYGGGCVQGLQLFAKRAV